MKSQFTENYKRPFFGASKVLVDKLDTLEGRWHVEFWDICYFAFGLELYKKRRKVVYKVKHHNKKIG